MGDAAGHRPLVQLRDARRCLAHRRRFHRQQCVLAPAEQLGRYGAATELAVQRRAALCVPACQPVARGLRRAAVVPADAVISCRSKLPEQTNQHKNHSKCMLAYRKKSENPTTYRDHENSIHIKKKSIFF